MLPQRLRRELRLQRIAFALTGLALGLLTSILANWLSVQWQAWIPVVLAIAVVFGAIGLFLYLRKPPGGEWVLKTPVTLRSAEESERYARRAYLGFVPLYTPQRNSTALQLTPEERQAAAEALEFDRLDLERSNFWPTVLAIKSHASHLERCWLLTTSGENAEDTQTYARLLAEFLKQRMNLRCDFVYDERYCIPLDDDALVLKKTYDQVRRVFAEAEAAGIGSSEMLADITTGTRSMSLGIVLACLDGNHDIQFVGTRYDASGRPAGTPFPIIYSVESA